MTGFLTVLKSGPITVMRLVVHSGFPLTVVEVL